MNHNEARKAIGEKVAEFLHKASGQMLSQNNDAVPHVMHMCLNTALCAIIPSVPLFVKKPKMSREEFDSEDGTKRLMKLLNYDAVLFAALVTARMHAGVSPVKEDADDEIKG